MTAMSRPWIVILGRVANEPTQATPSLFTTNGLHGTPVLATRHAMAVIGPSIRGRPPRCADMLLLFKAPLCLFFSY
ncbi:hypothetical protein M440DRAFT_1397486 [Trichoderma longibrachiatum ATCC 18648]|uniref:Uncharacterized protein n=1 Tax=Trichoderma longibrachiatum ATCC 18648 TaxID=983965 RepID=A0A2T4CF59_TRILO|nr:hypothetical protein M440DRAFT_1397486 [Trichoderma longibrachiatum ATCC 18648]